MAIHTGEQKSLGGMGDGGEVGGCGGGWGLTGVGAEVGGCVCRGGWQDGRGQGEGHRAVLTLSTGAGRNTLFRSTLPSPCHASQPLLTSPPVPPPSCPLSPSPTSPLSSANPSSQLTSELVDDVRLQLLHFFNADPQEYQVGGEGRGRAWDRGKRRTEQGRTRCGEGGRGMGQGQKEGLNKGGPGGREGKGGGRLTGHGRKGAFKEEG